MMTSSRTFLINVNGKVTGAYVPYADMLNHKEPRETAWYYDNERQGFVV